MQRERCYPMDDVTIIIFGASGDLSRRKLFPALYRLIKREVLKKFVIIGAALESVSAQDILAGTKKFIEKPDQTVFDYLSDRTLYQSLNFNNATDYAALHETVIQQEKKYGLSGNRMIYFAAASEFYCTITRYVAESHLAQRMPDKKKPWNRLIYEKPFGHNLASAQEINECIRSYFDENQIFRIDHFLTKELVSNIALVRFTNCVFEPLWNNRYIDQIQITVSESIGIEGRGAYYDKYGALADVVQNHMLELLALIAMESPEKLTGNYVRDRRFEVLKKTEIIDSLFGQYDSYLQEKNIKPNSKTETFAVLLLRINNPRWSGVPIYLKTGKFLDKKETVINIKFKQVDCLLTHSCPVPSNWLKFEVYPESVFSLSLNVKKPGRSDEVVPVPMEFCHSCIFGQQTPEAYEVVLEEVIRGEQTISVRFDEIETAWQIIDKVRNKKMEIFSYAPESKGPQEVETIFEKKHGMRWKS